MDKQKIVNPIPKVALTGLYDPAEEDESMVLPVPSQDIERQKDAAQMPHLIARSIVSLKLAHSHRKRVR
jgi:hypothetical protein